MKRITIFGLCAALFVTGSFGTRAIAQTDMSQFPLARAIPDDAFVAVAAKHNPDRKFLDAYWAEVSQAFFDGGFLDELWDLVGDTAPADQIDAMEAVREQFGELAGKVNWCQLFDKEMIHAGRFSQLLGPTFVYEGLLIGRLDEKSAKANYKALKGLLEEFCKFIAAKTGEDVLVVTESKDRGAKVATMRHADVPGVGVKLGVRKDLIILSFGATGIFDDALDLLESEAKGGRLIESARFKAATDSLPPAEDEVTFFDAERMLGTFRGFANSIAGAEKPRGGEEPGADGDEAAPVFKAITKILADVSIIDSVASVEWTDGYRVYSDSVATVRKDGKKSPICKIITSGKPLKDFASFIPKEADSFSVSAGIDLAGVYDYLTDLIKNNVPGGREKIAAFEEMQRKEWDIDIRKDVLQLFTGSSVSVEMGKDWAVLLEVTDEKKTDDLIGRLLTTINSALGQENGLMIGSIDVGAKTEFRLLSHPMMMMMGGMSPPVLGCVNGHVVLGSSAKIVRECIKTAAGKHANITQSERWIAEALAPAGKIMAVSFKNETRTAEKLQEGIGVAQMVLGMFGMFAMDAPPEARKLVSAVPPLLSKLMPVAAKLNFYKSSASYTSFEGGRWYTRRVQNYKSPAERPKPSEDEEAVKAQIKGR